MSKDHRLKPRKQAVEKKNIPLNFLLGCGQAILEDFELARLNEVADLRKELHTILDRLIDQMSQAALASWFRSQDRNSLKHAIENEESPEECAARMIRNRGRSEEELGEDGYVLPLPSLPPGAAHLAANLRYQQRNLAEGKCRVCPKPLAGNSVEYCEEHLAKRRHRDQQKKGLSLPRSREYLYSGEVTESTHGRQPGSLAACAMNREKKTRALLAELGVKPEDAAISLKAATEALLKVMPDWKHAMTQTELFDKAGSCYARDRAKGVECAARRETDSARRQRRPARSIPLLPAGGKTWKTRTG